MSHKHTVVLVLSAILGLAWAGCSAGESPGHARQISASADPASDDSSGPSGPSRVTEMSIDQLEQALAGGACAVLDANQRPVRIRNGVIPGARLLSHYQEYDLDELPADRHTRLVFYCANEQCRASDAAAEKALVAGYSDVHVLRAGIMGWSRAGKATQAVE
jgi:rhodanese-related sulfurtransferase